MVFAFTVFALTVFIARLFADNVPFTTTLFVAVSVDDDPDPLATHEVILFIMYNKMNFFTVSSFSLSQLSSAPAVIGENITVVNQATVRFLNVNQNATFLSINVSDSVVLSNLQGHNATFSGEIRSDRIQTNALELLTESVDPNAVVTNNRLETRLEQITKGPTGPTGIVGPPGQSFRIQTSVSSFTGLTGIFPGNHVVVGNNLYLYENGEYIFATSLGYTGPEGLVGMTGPAGRGLRFFAIGNATGSVTPISSNVGEFALVGNNVYVCDENLELQFVSTIDDTTALYGFEGPTGSIGHTGPTGETGYTGPTGAPGTSLRFFAVASSTGDISPTNENIGEFALVGTDVLVYSGNGEYTFVKHLVDVPTLQGPTGNAGPTGIQGPIGPSGRGMKVFTVADTFETVRPTYENIGEFAIVGNYLYVYTLSNSGTGTFTLLLPVEEAFRGSTGPAGPAGTGSSGGSSGKEFSLWLETVPFDETFYVGMDGSTTSTTTGTPGYKYQLPVDSGTYRIKTAYLDYKRNLFSFDSPSLKISELNNLSTNLLGTSTSSTTSLVVYANNPTTFTGPTRLVASVTKGSMEADGCLIHIVLERVV
jgi:hypothetical protein